MHTYIYMDTHICTHTYIRTYTHTHLCTHTYIWGFLGGSDGKESICNAGDPGSIPGSGRSPGQWIGYPLQYSWASLLIQALKNLPAVWETWVQSLGWEDALEAGVATHSSILAWRIPMDGGGWRAIVHGVTKSHTWLSDLAQHRRLKYHALIFSHLICSVLQLF